MTFRRPLPVPLPRAFSVADAFLHGVSKAQVRNPALKRPFHGARFAPGVQGELIDRCRAFSARTPRDHAFSHLTAAELHGMPLPAALAPGKLHVTSPAHIRATKAKGTVGHCATLVEGDLVERFGIPVTSVERTWCDLAGILDLGDLVAAGDLLLWHDRPLTTLERLQDAVARYPSRRGCVLMRQALPMLSAHSRSRPESIVRVALLSSDLPDPIPNFEVFLRSIRREIDLAYPAYKVGLEYQGDHHRTDRAQWRGDIRRGNDAVDEGWSMVYFTGDDLVDLPGILARTERRLRARGWPHHG